MQIQNCTFLFSYRKKKGDDRKNFRWEADVKARLVARGYEEENKDSLKADSPTISTDNLRLLFAIIATHHWKICDLDIKAVFLQGNPILRDIYLKPPVEAGKNKLRKLKTTVCGLVDVARSWYMTVKEELLKLGTEMSTFDEAFFIWRSEGELHGVIGCHVDDFIYGGSVLFNQQDIDKIKEKFEISREDDCMLKYVGQEVKQTQSEVTIDQQ